MKRRIPAIIISIIMIQVAAFFGVSVFTANAYAETILHAASDASFNKGQEVTGTFPRIKGMDVATVRYYVDKAQTVYAFAELAETEAGYTYSFNAPYNGFKAAEASEDSTAAADQSATVIAEYYSTERWDGAVDISWYDADSDEFEIADPAQLAGLAAIVNGSINSSTPIYRVKGERSDLTKTFDYDTPQTKLHQDINEGLPDCIENKYYEKTNLIASVQDEAYEGLAANDFSGKTVRITADLDMGGADPSAIDHSKNVGVNYYEGTYPNWTPIGGEYLMDPSRSATMIKASFNGTLDGCGHSISNLYCYRWSYRTVGDTAYGYAQGTGLIGMMGSLYDGEDQPKVTPAVRNMSLHGYIYGRRMVGGFVGCMGGGANAASGSSLECGINMENLANHAEIHCTDSKGLGGIVACSMLEKGSIINCYNTGYLDADYAAPTGGIIGSNEGMSVFCCYNIGQLYTHGNKRGRGIGCNNSGSNYKVSDCYYLEGCSDDDEYPGYYTYNLAKSVSVSTTAMTEKEMTDGTLLEKLNVNGNAYVAGDGGYPVLLWEKNAAVGSSKITLKQDSVAGSINATATGNMQDGTVVYLSNEPNTGWKCRYYLLNGSRLTGSYLTVNGNATVNGHFEEVKPGIITITNSDVCRVTVTKTGIIKNGTKTENVDDYPVKSGDAVYEGDTLIVETAFISGSTPDEVDLIYKAAAPDFFSKPYLYTYSYIDEDGEATDITETELETFKVGSEITKEGVALTLDVKALTTQKMWDYAADTDWYDSSKNSYVIRNAAQLAGLSVLVDKGVTFEGKTIRLGNDISLANNDGTPGTRYWDGIGSAQSTGYGFAGTFDGVGHAIKDYSGNANGLFEYCKGASSDNKAVIQNLELWGTSYGQNACGIAMKADNTFINNCVCYCTTKGTTSNGHTASILGYAGSGCEISNCINYAEVNGEGYVGGIVGQLGADCAVTGCVNKGNVFSRSTGGNSIGGIVGNLYGQIYRSFNYGNIRAYGRNLGGIAGQSVWAKAVIDGCGNAGRVIYERGTNSLDAAGGMIGFASLFNVRNSFNYGAVEILSGVIPESNLGGAFGRVIKNSKNLTEDVYYLDTTCEYSEGGVKPENLDREAGYSKGVKAASSSAFASGEGVLADINDDAVFVMSNGSFPELDGASDLHVHTGGVATCSELAVCDVCGLTYGLYSQTHQGDAKLTGARDAVWMTDGYTGDYCCTVCGSVITRGEVIPADKDREAISVIVKNSSENTVKSYSVKEFDALKSTEPSIGYSYGSKSKEITVATEYVTLERLLKDFDLTTDDVLSVVVKCEGSTSTVSAETLATCNKYYENGKEYDAPAAFMISWNSGVGTLNEVAQKSSIGGTVRFGYGISEAQQNEAVGGARLVSPVETVTINISETARKVSIKKAAISGLTVKKGKKLVVKMKTTVSDTGGSQYVVQYRQKGTSKWNTVTTTKQTVTIKKLKAGKKYQARVRAVKGTFAGAWSTVKTSKKIKK